MKLFNHVNKSLNPGKVQGGRHVRENGVAGLRPWSYLPFTWRAVLRRN
jgi:hypothetical protein